MREIKRLGLRKHSATFSTETEAAMQYDAWMRERARITGQECRVNFPLYPGEKQVVKRSSWGCQCTCDVTKQKCAVYYDAGKRKFRASGVGYFDTPELACRSFKQAKFTQDIESEPRIFQDKQQEQTHGSDETLTSGVSGTLALDVVHQDDLEQLEDLLRELEELDEDTFSEFVV